MPGQIQTYREAYAELAKQQLPSAVRREQLREAVVTMLRKLSQDVEDFKFDDPAQLDKVVRALFNEYGMTGAHIYHGKPVESDTQLKLEETTLGDPFNQLIMIVNVGIGDKMHIYIY